ncbi:MAG: DUF4956 domain-containing protein [Phycisphaerales bacterium]
MPDWLQSPFQPDVDLDVGPLAVKLLVAFGLGCVVAGIYRFTHGRASEQSRALIATLVLITILISMMTLVIGSNVARAFSIVGALSIVRFRTVVEDTRDTAFVIFAVAVGTAIGAGHIKLPLVCIPVAAVAACLFRPRGLAAAAGAYRYVLTVRMNSGLATEAPVRSAMAGHVEASSLRSIETARQGAAVEITYAIALRGESDATPLVAKLNGLEGLQSVELSVE